MSNIMIGFVMMMSTIGLFFIMLKVYQKLRNPFLLPILTVTVIIGVLLVLFDISYETYMVGGEWLQKILGPAVVALAVPLYKQRKLINKYKLTIVISVVCAMMIGLFSVFIFLLLFKASDAFILTAFPKSLTTPVAMEVSQTIGGIPPLTAVMVMVAGFTGAILGPYLFQLFKIESAISRGLAMGSASHGVGTSKLAEYGEETLSVGSLAMSLSAVVGAFICPLFVWVFI